MKPIKSNRICMYCGHKLKHFKWGYCSSWVDDGSTFGSFCKCNRFRSVEQEENEMKESEVKI